MLDSFNSGSSGGGATVVELTIAYDETYNTEITTAAVTAKELWDLASAGPVIFTYDYEGEAGLFHIASSLEEAAYFPDANPDKPSSGRLYEFFINDIALAADADDDYPNNIPVDEK